MKKIKYTIILLAIIMFVSIIPNIKAEEIVEVINNDATIETVINNEENGYFSNNVEQDNNLEDQPENLLNEDENLNLTNEEEETTNIDIEPGEVTASKEAEVVLDENGDATREADVTITLQGESFTTMELEEREVVLVLDDSGSMAEEIGAVSKMDLLTGAASDLIDNLLVEDNNGKIKVGIIYYGTQVKGTCVLSTNKIDLQSCLDSMNSYGGTNIQSGIRNAKDLFTNSTTSAKTIILLSDGIPTYYEEDPIGDETQGILHGAGNSDDYEDTEYYDDQTTLSDNNKKQTLVRTYYKEYAKQTVVKTCTYERTRLNNWEWSRYQFVGCITEKGYRPSDGATLEANEFKNKENDLNGDIFTVGFGIEQEGPAEIFLKTIASDENKYFLASSLVQLENIFKAIENQINLIATNVKVVDTIPDKFEINEEYFETNFGTATQEENGTVTYGEKVNVKVNEDKTSTLTWTIGDLNSTSVKELTFRINAKENYYGNMFTNNGATVTGAASNGNPFYTTTNNISILLADPTVGIPAVTLDDNYSTDQGQTLIVSKTDGIRKNDYSDIQKDDNAVVTDEIVIVDNVSNGTLTMNHDGSFSYLAPTDYYGNVKFTYYIKTTININGQSFMVKSNISEGTIAVNRIPTSYVVHHYVKGTTEKLADDEIGNGYVYEKVTGTAKNNFINYQLVGTESSKTITLINGTNEINFYYELKDGGAVTVHHYVKGTTEKLADDERKTGKVTENYTTSAQTFENYKLVATPANANGTFTLEEQTVTYYYELKDGGVVTVHHYVKGTTEKLADDERKTGKVTENYTTSAQTFENYKLVATPANANGTFTLEEQTVTYYYELKDGGVVTVYYYEENTETELATKIELNGDVTTNYVTTAELLENWELVSTPTNANGTFTLEEQVVIYYYRKVMGKVVTHYVDEYGKPLVDSIETIQQTGTPYSTEQKEFENYDFLRVEGKTIGEYTKEDTVITYVYQYNDPIPNTGITDNYIIEGLFILSLSLLFGTIIFRKKVFIK